MLAHVHEIFRRVRVATGTDYRVFEGLRIPLPQHRFCTSHYEDSSFYVASADREVARLVARCGLTANSQLLDIGFGQGRLAIGLLRWFPQFQGYHGVDVHGPSVHWCQRNIGARFLAFRFLRLLAANRRYNLSGAPIDQAFRLPFRDGQFDVMFLYSVFTHMDEEDVRVYLREMKRTLAPGGSIFATLFVEDGVPDFEENPADYLTEMYPRLDGALHIVRFSTTHFRSMVESSGLRVAELRYREEAHLNQSTVVLQHAE